MWPTKQATTSTTTCIAVSLCMQINMTQISRCVTCCTHDIVKFSQQPDNHRPEYIVLMHLFHLQLRQPMLFGFHQLQSFPFPFSFLVFAAHRRIVWNICRRDIIFIAVSAISSRTGPLLQPCRLSTVEKKNNGRVVVTEITIYQK